MFQSTGQSRPLVRRKTSGCRAAFTLVEIILAIGLATALLLAALMFYQQTTELRGQILRESDQVSGLRLVLDRVAGDLRSAQPRAIRGNEFNGDTTSMQFIKVTSAGPSINVAPGMTDLVRVSLATITSTNGTNLMVTGLDRLETPLYQTITSNAPALNLDGLAQDLPDETNQMKEPFADMIRFVRFRYWDGAAWQSGWTNATPPPGVEILLATTGLAGDAGPDVYPPDMFRRVVFLPGGVPHPATESGFSADSSIH